MTPGSAQQSPWLTIFGITRSISSTESSCQGSSVWIWPEEILTSEEILLRWEAPGYTGIIHLLIMGGGDEIMLKSMGWILRDLPLQSSMKFGFGVTNCTLNTQISILLDPSSTLVRIFCSGSIRQNLCHERKEGGSQPKVKDESFGANLRTKAPSLKDGPGSISWWQQNLYLFNHNEKKTEI